MHGFQPGAAEQPKDTGDILCLRDIRYLLCQFLETGLKRPVGIQKLIEGCGVLKPQGGRRPFTFTVSDFHAPVHLFSQPVYGFMIIENEEKRPFLS